MHEMSVALEIRSICERELARQPESKLITLGLAVGVFSGVEVETLRFCLDVVMKERFDGVRCEIEREAGVAVCFGCGHEFEVLSAPFECPRCGGLARGASGGQSLRVSYLEVE